jgi:hypothetical protein
MLAFLEIEQDDTFFKGFSSYDDEKFILLHSFY